MMYLQYTGQDKTSVVRVYILYILIPACTRTRNYNCNYQTIVLASYSYVRVIVVEFWKVFLRKLLVIRSQVTLFDEAATKQLQWVARELLRKSAE